MQFFKLQNIKKGYLIKQDNYGFFIKLYVADEKVFDFYLSFKDKPSQIKINEICIRDLLNEFKITLPYV